MDAVASDPAESKESLVGDVPEMLCTNLCLMSIRLVKVYDAINNSHPDLSLATYFEKV